MPHELPAHASPAITPQGEQGYPQLTSKDLEDANAATPPALVTPTHHLDPSDRPGPGEDWHPPHSTSEHGISDTIGTASPPYRSTKSIPRAEDDPAPGTVTPSLLPSLPSVDCQVRARIPTTSGSDMWLHVYSNDVDGKEHIAIVFGDNPAIRSRSLFAERPGETEADRMRRGAYEGKLHPGRTSSRVGLVRDESHSSLGKMSPLQRGLHKRQWSQGQGAGVGQQQRNDAQQKDADADVKDATPLPGAAVAYPSNTQTAAGAGWYSDFPGFEEGPRSPGSASSSASTADTPSSTPPPAEGSRAMGDGQNDESPLVRIHSECYTGETVWSARCDCGEQLDEAARLMSTPADPESPTTGSGGVIIYLRQEGRGIGLSEKLKAYNLQDLGYDTYEANILLRHPADARSYGLATAMLVDLGLGGEKGIRLLTNNPDKIRAVEGPNKEVQVKERVAMVPLAWSSHGEKGVRGKEVEGYLSAKIAKFGHMLERGG